MMIKKAWWSGFYASAACSLAVTLGVHLWERDAVSAGISAGICLLNVVLSVANANEAT